MGKAEDKTETCVSVPIRATSKKLFKLDDFPLRPIHNFYSSARWIELGSRLSGVEEGYYDEWLENYSNDSDQVSDKIKNYFDQSVLDFAERVSEFQIQNCFSIEADGIETPFIFLQENSDQAKDIFERLDLEDVPELDWIFDVTLKGKATVAVEAIYGENKNVCRSPEILAAFLYAIASEGGTDLVSDPYQEFLSYFDLRDQARIEQSVQELEEYDKTRLDEEPDILPGHDYTCDLKPIGRVQKETKVYLEPNQDLRDINNLRKNTGIDSMEI